MSTILIFLILSVPVIYFSRNNLINPEKHGFYRFFGWEGTLWVFVNAIPYWFDNPLSTSQVFSWILLFGSLLMVIYGTLDLIGKGKPHQSRKDRHLFSFEKTTQLVDTGIFRYIRHPLYGSLIFLTWGMYLKQPDLVLGSVTIISSIMYYITALYDEKECVTYFGNKYVDYMKRSKMFIPFLF